MADSASAASGIAESNTVIPVSPASGRAAQQATAVGAAIPTPSALLSLGAPIPGALTYDAAGLLRALESSAAARTLLSSSSSSSASSLDAAALTGVNTDASRSGLLNAPVSLQTVPFNAQFAVQNLLAGQTPASQAASIAALQADALNQSATSLTAPSTAAAVINASGGLQTLTPDVATAALVGLQGTDLGLAAAGLGVNTATPSFIDTTGALLAPSSDSTSQALSGLLTSNLSLANAQFSANLAASPATVGANQTLGTVLASDVDLTTAAAQATASSTAVTSATAATIAAAAATTTAPTASAPITASVAITPVVSSAAALAVAAATPTPATPAATAAAGTPATVETAATTATVAGAAPEVAAATAQTVNLNFLVDAAAQARTTITANPNYAAMAATLYANAAIFRAMPESSRGAPVGGGAADLRPPVAATLNIRAVRPV